MQLEVMLSTINLKDIGQAKELIQKMNVKTSILIINQITEDILPWNYNDGNIRIYSYVEKGLSKSRNHAINKANADIEIIADDDVIYKNDYEEIIKKAYEKYKDADIIAFYVESKNKERKIKKQKNHKVNFITAMKIQSMQITLKKDKIKGITFNEKFGAGSKYFMGEESIFLYKCLKEKKNIYYVDEKIGEVEQKNSTWYRGFSKEFFAVEGAIFYEITKKFYKILIIQYAIRKKKEYKDKMKIKEAIKYMLEGAKKYKNNERRKS